ASNYPSFHGYCRSVYELRDKVLVLSKQQVNNLVVVVIDLTLAIQFF
ncbi:37938_t:CDS:1, partial [Gigaspora margarita]